MNSAKSFTQPIAMRVAFFNLLAFLAVTGSAYWLLRVAGEHVGRLAQAQPTLDEVKQLVDGVATLSNAFWPYFVPAAFLLFVVLAVLTSWSVLGAVGPRIEPSATRRPSPPSAKPKEEKRPQSSETDKRVYLHLIGVLQKEGRLLDFFSEDLGQYNDGQIGAAVRSIHENCNKALNGHIGPQFVLDAQEGDEIVVEKDFDPNTLKLVGNVTGEPPFKGVVRHRGWRARKVDLPTFSGRQTADIIAPAEVEVH